MTPHELIVAAGVAIAAASYLCGSLAPWWRILEWAHRDYLDDIYAEGYDDGRRAVSDHRARHSDELGSQAPTAALLAVRDLPAPAPAFQLRGDQGESDVHRPSDWRADYAEQLAAAVLDAENLPGPEALPAPRAGEHHDEDWQEPQSRWRAALEREPGTDDNAEQLIADLSGRSLGLDADRVGESRGWAGEPDVFRDWWAGLDGLQQECLLVHDLMVREAREWAEIKAETREMCAA